MSTADPAAAGVPDQCGDAGPPLSERGWRVTVVGMHVVSGGLWALAVGLTVIDPDLPRPTVLAVLAVLAAAYVGAGSRALGGGRPALGLVYVAALVAGLGVLGFLAPGLLFLLFLAYPQVWFVAPSTITGAAAAVALTLSSASGPVVGAATGQAQTWQLLSAGVSMLLALALGLWISRIIEHSQQRAVLIRQLERTRAELAAAERERGVLAERERLAAEVHDTLAQGYTSIVVLAQTAAAQVGPDPDGARERLALIEEVARDNLQEARAVVAAFAPVALESSTLAEALGRLAERFGRETGLAVRIDTSALAPHVALRRDEEVVLLRGAQEALTNVRRHAAARSVVVRLTAVGEGESRQVSVHVEDDGVGFDPASAHASGLDGLRGRVASVGGGVDVVSAPGEGTRVTLRVPAG